MDTFAKIALNHAQNQGVIACILLPTYVVYMCLPSAASPRHADTSTIADCV